jgi:CDP-ribitol ribitolphosphotransferase
MMKRAGYLVFAFFYYLARVFRRNPKKIFLVATHDDSPEGNIGIVAQAIREKYSDYELIWFTRKDKITNPVNFFLKKPYHLATSSYVFLDNGFLPMAYLHFPKEVKVVQLWHGTGTIKKFGQDANTGTLKKLEYRANQKITHLIINSEAVKEEYASAFGVPEERIYAIGLPRTDILVNEAYMAGQKREFLEKYPMFAGKKVVLYAPTFRDDEVDNPKIALDLRKLSEELPEDMVFLLRLHPFVAQHFQENLKEDKFTNIFNLSAFSGVTTLLAAADVLVTDYSSIIFEYCLRQKPMLFYAYDLEKFEKEGRSFYRDYRSFVPGEIVDTQEQLVDALKRQNISQNEHFIEEMFDRTDGNSTDRLLELIF